MINKKDPLIAAVQQVMQNSQNERNAVNAVNEKFGVTDRKALPHEQQSAWDAAYKTVLNEGVEALDYDNYSPRNIHPELFKDEKLDEKVQMTQRQFANLDGKPEFTANDLAHARKKTHIKKAAAGTLEEDDTTSPSSMGIKKPDYAPAGTTPDYAKPTTQTVNRAAKTSLPAGTLKKAMNEEQLEEKASAAQKAKIAKVMHKWKQGKEKIGKSEKTVPVTKSGQKQAVAIALSQAGLSKKKKLKEGWATANKRGMLKSKKKLEEGFNNRHDLSVTASAEKQVVADQFNEGAAPRPMRPAAKVVRKPAARIGDTGIRKSISGTNDVQTRLANARQSAPALDSRDTSLDQPSTKSPMARTMQAQDAAKRANMSGGGTMVASRQSIAQDAAKRANMSGGGTMAASRQSIAQDAAKRANMSGGGTMGTTRPGQAAIAAKKANMSGGGVNKLEPKSTVPTSTEKPTVTQTTDRAAEPTTFKAAFAAARRAAAEKGAPSTGRFKFKGREYQTNIKGEKYISAGKQTSVSPAQSTTKTNVTGGQGISGISSTSTNKPTAAPANSGMAAAAKEAGTMAVNRMKSQSSLASNMITKSSSSDSSEWQKGPDTSFNARHNYGPPKSSTTQRDVRSTSNPERVANPTFVPQKPSDRISKEVGQELSSTLDNKRAATYGGSK